MQRRSTVHEIQSGMQQVKHSMQHNVTELVWPDFTSNVTLTGSVAVDLDAADVMQRFNELEVDAADVRLGTQLGKGAFGSVCLADIKLSGHDEPVKVAVKTMNSQNAPEAEIKQFEYEAKLLTALSHGNIVSVVAVHFRTTPQMLCLELMLGGDLKSYLVKHRNELEVDSEELLVGACLQIARAMAYLERRKVVHRDLAARFVGLMWLM